MSNSKKNVCLVCDDPEIDKRGLCTSCYEKYRREKAKVPPTLVDRWETQLVERGCLLPDARLKRNVFQDMRLEIEQEVAEQSAEYTVSDEEPIRVPVGKKSRSRKKQPPGTAQTQRKQNHG